MYFGSTLSLLEIIQLKILLQLAAYRSYKQHIVSPEIAILTTLIITVSSRKNLRTKETPDFNLEYSKMGESGVGIKMIKSVFFRYFSIKSYVVDVY